MYCMTEGVSEKLCTFWKKWGDKIFFGVLFAIYLVLTLFLFHRQTVHYGGRYVSDMGPYVAEIRQRGSSGYDFPYPVMFWIAGLFARIMTPEHALAVSLTGLNGLTALSVRYVCGRLTGTEEKGTGWKCLISLFTFLILFASMLYPFHFLGQYHESVEDFLYRYLGVFTPNPWHNATYLAARPFSIIAFFLAADLLAEYESINKWFWKKQVLFALALLTSAMTKPSFTLVLSAACGIVMLWRLARGRFRGWKAFWQLGIAFVPTFADMLYQYSNVFAGQIGQEGNKGIGVGLFRAWGAVSDNIPLAVLLAGAFPFCVLLFRGRKGRPREPWYVLAWQFYGVSLGMLAVLYEKGFRMEHVNFSWGYMYGLFFLYMASCIVLLKETAGRGQALWKLAVQWSVFAAHVVCGLDYFRVMLEGGIFW